MDETLRNLIALCDTLRKKGKRVCLGTVTTPNANEESPLNPKLTEFCAR